MGSGNWISLSDESGVNDKTLLLTASANPGVQTRSATITVQTIGLPPLSIIVTQEGGAPTLNINADTLIFTSEGSNASPLFVMTNTSWFLQSSDEWISATPASGGNFGQIVVKVAENTGGSKRTGNITVTVDGLQPKVIVVRQEAPAGK